MISAENKSHQKHAKLKRPQLGHFGRTELAVLGTPCGNIKKLFSSVSEHMASIGPIGFVDADHQASPPDGSQYLYFTDKISFRRFDYAGEFNQFQRRPYFNHCELVLVNGNHFAASAQIVVVDPKKPLEKKLDRLTNPVLVVKMDSVEIPDYLESYLNNVPVVQWRDQTEIAEFIRNWTVERLPKIKGLVLAGGHSVRMKRDKGAIAYHGVSQRQYLYEQLSQMGYETFVSCRNDQIDNIEQGLPVLPDTFNGLGPMGALLSAFREDPDAAWLIVACDLPYLTNETLKFLVENRDQAKVATAFQNSYDGFPEPLITIWEPRSYGIIFNFLSQGYSCPRKVLINSEIKLLTAPDPKELSNVNHPDEYQAAVADLRSKV
ncbi:MAG: hypothetical protein DHS20C17_10130 [Cyclobacteriaceae bacterium]|nr:MAG: hypothetical protein DHS20C17_10130 [Cyclobacteriaceae bacterium]